MNPALFDEFERLLDSIEKGEASFDEADIATVEMLESFLEQFSSEERGRSIVGFNKKSYKRLAKWRRGLEREKPVDLPTVLLIQALQDLNGVIDEVMYSDPGPTVQQFHENELVAVLAAIAGWSASKHWKDGEFAIRSRAVSDRLEDLVEA